MVGTKLDGRGGVASVLRTWKQFGLMDRWRVIYVPTNGPGGTGKKALLAIRAWWKCAWLIVGGRIELVHVHTSSYSSFWRKSPIFATAILSRRPLVVSLHGGAFRDFYASRSRLGKAWIRLVMRRAERFILLTDSWKQWGDATEPRIRAVVIPNPVPELPELSKLGESKPESNHRGAESSAAMPVLLFLGRIEAEKGIFVLLEALATAKRNGAQWQLVCGGTGDLGAARQCATRLGLSNEEVRFVGWVDGEAKRDWLRKCDMLVLPSFIENMPVALLEAFAYGKPVLATRVGGIPDIVLDGVDGFLFPPGDQSALAQLLTNSLESSANLKSMGVAARKKALLQYSPEHVIGQIEATYKQLLCPTDDSPPNRPPTSERPLTSFTCVSPNVLD